MRYFKHLTNIQKDQRENISFAIKFSKINLRRFNKRYETVSLVLILKKQHKGWLLHVKGLIQGRAIQR